MHLRRGFGDADIVGNLFAQAAARHWTTLCGPLRVPRKRGERNESNNFLAHQNLVRVQVLHNTLISCTNCRWEYSTNLMICSDVSKSSAALIVPGAR